MHLHFKRQYNPPTGVGVHMHMMEEIVHGISFKIFCLNTFILLLIELPHHK